MSKRQNQQLSQQNDDDDDDDTTTIVSLSVELWDWILRDSPTLVIEFSQLNQEFRNFARQWLISVPAPVSRYFRQLLFSVFNRAHPHVIAEPTKREMGQKVGMFLWFPIFTGRGYPALPIEFKRGKKIPPEIMRCRSRLAFAPFIAGALKEREDLEWLANWPSGGKKIHVR